MITTSRKRPILHLFWAIALAFAPSMACGQQLEVGHKQMPPQGIRAPYPNSIRPHTGVLRPAAATHNLHGQMYHGRFARGRGHWHHAMRMGRSGWWWVVGGMWYFYPELSNEPPQEPPTYVSDIQVEGAGQPITPTPPPPEKPHHTFYYRPGDLQGVPYDTLEECTAIQKRAGNGVCIVK
jgi:hypothetical protein